MAKKIARGCEKPAVRVRLLRKFPENHPALFDWPRDPKKKREGHSSDTIHNPGAEVGYSGLPREDSQNQ